MDFTRENILMYGIRALVLITAMPVHECAHGIAADKLGDDTPREQGRITLNPFAHLDLMGSVLLLLTGFGWAKPVQVDMRNFKNPRRDMAITSLAGPVSNLVLATVTMIIIRLVIGFCITANYVPEWFSMFMNICETVIVINISLAVFNFLPVPPLDGSKIIGAVLPDRLYWGMLRYQTQISIVVMALLFFNILPLPIRFLASYVGAGISFITSPVSLLFR